MKKIIALMAVVILFPFGSIINCFSKYSKSYNGVCSYLLVGLDDAAQNADTIILLNVNLSDKVVDFVHIPRDTLYSSFDHYGKINSLTSKLKSEGKQFRDVLDAFSHDVSEGIGVEIDAYAACTVSALESIVDILGGVTLELPVDFVCENKKGEYITLKKGQNRLSGREACAFVRHRKSYMLGDLSRCNAQKIFLNGLLKTFRNRMDYETIVKILSLNGSGIYSDLSTKDILSGALSLSQGFSDFKIRFSTLPGTALIGKNKISYYVINRPATARMLYEMKIISTPDDFDQSRRFNYNSDVEINKAYNCENVKYKIYLQEEIDSLIIQ